MKLMKTFVTICTFLCVTFTIDCFGNDSLAVFYQSRADSFYKSGNFEKAIVDCERALFNVRQFKPRTSISLLKAECFKQMGNFSDANLTLVSMRTIGLDTNTICQIHYEQALNSYLLGMTDEAGSQITQIELLTSGKEFTQNSTFLKILVLNELALWDSAVQIIKHSQYLSVSEKEELATIYKSKPRLFNAKRLDWYSRFIPGSGQIITGHVFEGAMSFLFCATALTFGAYEVYTGYYLTGYFLGAGFLNGFYYGGLRRLKVLVDYENQKRKEGLNGKVKDYLKK